MKRSDFIRGLGMLGLGPILAKFKSTEAPPPPTVVLPKYVPSGMSCSGATGAFLDKYQLYPLTEKAYTPRRVERELLLDDSTIKALEIRKSPYGIFITVDGSENIKCGDVIADITTGRPFLVVQAKRLVLFIDTGEQELTIVPVHANYYRLTRRQRAIGNEFRIFRHSELYRTEAS